MSDPHQRELREMHAVPPTRDYLEEMWRRRDFATALPFEQLQAQHQATLLGNLWHLMNPLLTVFTFYIVFGLMLKVSEGQANYLGFLVCGVFAFGFTTRCFVDGARSIEENGGLMRSIRFPRALIPVSNVISKLITFGYQLAILAVVAIVSGAGVSRRWFLLPLLLILHSAFNLGGAFITARLNDSFRDIEHLIPFIMQLLSYGSGMMFPIWQYAENAPGWVQTLVRWNPLVTMLDLYRWMFIGSEIRVYDVLRLVVITALLVILGFRYFVAAEPRYGRG